MGHFGNTGKLFVINHWVEEQKRKQRKDYQTGISLVSNSTQHWKSGQFQENIDFGFRRQTIKGGGKGRLFISYTLFLRKFLENLFQKRIQECVTQETVEVSEKKSQGDSCAAGLERNSQENVF